MSSLQNFLMVYNAHNGDCILIPKPLRFHVLSDFKAHVASELGVDAIDNLFILSSFGFKLDFNLINDLSDVYVYDRRLFSPLAPSSNLHAYLQISLVVPQIEFPHISLEKPLDSITNVLRLQQELKLLLADSKRIADCSKKCARQINIMFRSLNLIYLFCTNFVNDTQKNFSNYFSYIKLLNYKTLHSSWHGHYALLCQFPKFHIQKLQFSLASFLNEAKLKASSQLVQLSLPLIVDKFNQMSTLITAVGEERDNVLKQIGELRKLTSDTVSNADPDSIIASLSEYAKPISDIVPSSDLTVLQSFTQVNYPAIRKEFDALQVNLTRLVDFRKKLAINCLQVFSAIAEMQKKMVDVKMDLKVLTTCPADNSRKSELPNTVSFDLINRVKLAEDYLSLSIDLPLLFGYVLCEKRRQQEWNQVYSRDIVANASEQLSAVIGREEASRRKWTKKFGRLIEMVWDVPPRVHLPSLDITLLGAKSLPLDELISVNVERSDIVSYINLVENHAPTKGLAPALDKHNQDMTKQLAALRHMALVVSSISSEPLDSGLKSSLLPELAQPSRPTFTAVDGELQRTATVGSVDGYVDKDFDAAMVEGLKKRIKKLESLLHQQLYQDIGSWPVTRANGPPHDSVSRMSLIVDPKSGPVRKTSLIFNLPSLTTNPTLLLNRRNTVAEPGGKSTILSKILDLSGIDKHIDNIRLKKENADLTSRASMLEDENKASKEKQRQLELTIAALTLEKALMEQQIHSLGSDRDAHATEMTRLRLKHENQQQSYNAQIAEFAANAEQASLSAKQECDSNNSQLEAKLKELAIASEAAEVSAALIQTHESTISQLEARIKELSLALEAVKGDVAENQIHESTMSRQETEIEELSLALESVRKTASVNQQYESRIMHLESRVKELTLLLETAEAGSADSQETESRKLEYQPQGSAQQLNDHAARQFDDSSSVTQEAKIKELALALEAAEAAAETIKDHESTISQQETKIKELLLALETANAAVEASVKHEFTISQQESKIKELILALKTTNVDAEKMKDNTSTISQQEAKIKELTLAVDAAVEEIRDCKSTILQLEASIKELTLALGTAEAKAMTKEKQIQQLNGSIKELNDDLTDEVAMKNDLLTNMASKASEYAREVNTLELEIKGLQQHLDERTEDYEHLVEVARGKQKANESAIQELCRVANLLAQQLVRLVGHSYDNFVEMCFILESMGLLLVKEQTELRIIRVKGLRPKSNNSNEDLSKLQTTLSTTVVNEYSEKISAIRRAFNGNLTPNDVHQGTDGNASAADKAVQIKDEVERPTSEVNTAPLDTCTTPETSHPTRSTSSTTEESREQSESQASVSDYVDSNMKHEAEQVVRRLKNLENSGDNLLNEFFDMITFKRNALSNSVNSQSFFLAAISKRFNDVEGFAKRQAKESKSKQQILNRLMLKLGSSIAINNFQLKDLALFLPTRVEYDKGTIPETKIKPWAAFNVGAPHYFLRNDDQEQTLVAGKEWMVARIRKIEEKRVTVENFADPQQNPFQLSVGLTWFLVQASEEV